MHQRYRVQMFAWTVIVLFGTIGTAAAAPTYSSQAGPLDAVVPGGYANVTFVDIDADGDFDCFPDSNDASVLFYENTGTPAAASFTQQTGANNPFDAFGGLRDITFVDIDNDGDKDAFTGAGSAVKFFENTGNASSPTFVERTGSANPFDGVAAANSVAQPTFVDIDNDGDFDCFVGNQDGNIKFFENTGSVSTPAFTERTGVNNPLDGDFGTLISPEFADLDFDGDYDVIIGDFATGGLLYYRNDGTAAAASFTNASALVNGFNFAANGVRPGLVDIDDDGDTDIFVAVDSAAIEFLRNDDPDIPQNGPPTPQDDTFSGGSAVDEDSTNNILAVLANDTDPDNDDLTVVGVTTPDQGGAATITSGGGSITYTPATNFFGTETFTYSVSDGVNPDESASVTVSVLSVNDPPTITVNTGTTVDQGRTIEIGVTELSSTDIDDDDSTLVYTVTSGPSNGQLELKSGVTVPITTFTQADIVNGRLVYANDGESAASDSFNFSVADGGEDGAAPDTGVFSITVSALGPADNVFVDFSFVGGETGSTTNPFNTLGEGVDFANDDAVVRVKDGISNETGTLDRPMTFKRWGDTGAAQIGVGAGPRGFVSYGTVRKNK